MKSLMAVMLVMVMGLCASCDTVDNIKDEGKRNEAAANYEKLVGDVALAAAEAKSALDRIDAIADTAESVGLKLPAEPTSKIRVGLDTAERRLRIAKKYTGMAGGVPGPQQPFVNTTETVLGILLLGVGSLASFFRKRERSAKAGVKGIVAGIETLSPADKATVRTAIGNNALKDTGIDAGAIGLVVAAAKNEINRDAAA